MNVRKTARFIGAAGLFCSPIIALGGGVTYAMGVKNQSKNHCESFNLTDSLFNEGKNCCNYFSYNQSGGGAVPMVAVMNNTNSTADNITAENVEDDNNLNNLNNYCNLFEYKADNCKELCERSKRNEKNGRIALISSGYIGAGSLVIALSSYIKLPTN